jgi:hypothetical protein
VRAGEGNDGGDGVCASILGDVSSLQPPEPPTGDHDDPDAGWNEYEGALEEYQAALLREQLLATGVQWAIRKDETELALALLDADIADLRPDLPRLNHVTMDFEASIEAFRVLSKWAQAQGDYDDRYPSLLFYHFADLMPSGMTLIDVVVRPRLAKVEEGWRDRVRGQMEGEASNQGTDYGTKRPVLHNGLYYRSESEVKIAEALEKVDGVLFFPNSGAMSHGAIREPDFLIVYRGKMGVLEVDGMSHEGRAAEDSARDSYFQRHGLFVKHYPAEVCYDQPKMIVGDFLSLLAKST